MKRSGLLAGAIILPVALILGLVIALTSDGNEPANACTPSAGPVNAAAIPADASVSGYGRDQLANAAAIINAAAQLNLPPAAQSLGVQAALGESSLVNINYGDNAVNPDGSIADSIGLFQQQSSWGTVAERMDPTTSATRFFERLAAVQGWETLEPSIAINRVQINSDPFHYVKWRPAAIAITAYLGSLSGGGSVPAGCSVSGDAAELAQGLAAALDDGTLTIQEQRYEKQIRDMAAGTAAEGCLIDLPVLQLITLALQRFESVGLSDLNRRCAGSNLGTNAHWINGGGNAVDFISLGGQPVTGNTPETFALLDLLAGVAPKGTRVGQNNCRSASAALAWPTLVQFWDTCHHQHIDFLYTSGTLNVAP
ncbi:hypothetical protein [Microbacterium arborescens]